MSLTPEQMEKHKLQLAIIDGMHENSEKTGFESVTKHALWVMRSRYKQLLDTVEALATERDIYRSDYGTAQQRIAELEDKVEAQAKEIAEADAWREYWRREAFRKYPTPEAYEAACAALQKHRERADAAEAKVGDQATELREYEEELASANAQLKELELDYADIVDERLVLIDKVEAQAAEIAEKERLQQISDDYYKRAVEPIRHLWSLELRPGINQMRGRQHHRVRGVQRMMDKQEKAPPCPGCSGDGKHLFSPDGYCYCRTGRDSKRENDEKVDRYLQQLGRPETA